MDQRTKPALAAAVAAGYVIGRTKKGRLALTAVALITGRSLEPRRLAAEGLRQLRTNPAVDALVGQVRGEVYQAARAAAGAAVTRRFGSLGGAAGEAAGAAGGAAGETAGKAAGGAKKAAGKAAGAGDDEESRDEEEREAPESRAEEAAPRRKAPARKKAAPKRSPSGRGSGGGEGERPKKAARSAPAKRAKRTGDRR